MTTKFDIKLAAKNLDIEFKPFGYTGVDGYDLPNAEKEVRGYSIDRFLCINPGERWPELVAFHEMTHILNGDTVCYEKFGLTKTMMNAGISGNFTPTEKDFEKLLKLEHYKNKYHDLIEAECHITAILAAKLTDTPMDLESEVNHLVHCYTMGRDLPKSVLGRAYRTAGRIRKAGMVG